MDSVVLRSGPCYSVTMSIVTHVFQGTMYPYSWVMITHIWLKNRQSVIPFEASAASWNNSRLHQDFMNWWKLSVTPISCDLHHIQGGMGRRGIPSPYWAIREKQQHVIWMLKDAQQAEKKNLLLLSSNPAVLGSTGVDWADILELLYLRDKLDSLVSWWLSVITGKGKQMTLISLQGC